MKSIKAIQQTLITALFFINPFLVTTFTYELFEFPKMIFVYVITPVILAIAVTVWLLGPNISNSFAKETASYLIRSKISLLLVAFVGANAVSTFFSSFTYTSWWGYYSRFSGGLVSLLCYLSIFFVLKTLTKDHRQDLLKIVVWASFFVSVYGVLQHFGLEKDRWIQDVTARVFSSFGQPNWLAAYLVLVIPINIYFFLVEKAISKKVLLAILAIVNFAALWFTFSLSGLLAFAASMCLFLILLDPKVRQKNAKWLVALVLLWLAVCIWQPGLAAGRVSDAINAASRRLSLVTAALAATAEPTKTGDTADIRLIIWPGALNLASSSFKNFAIGTGPETFAYTFLPFRPIEMNHTSEGGFLYNKAHNYFLDLLCNVGVLGLFVYLLLNFYAIYISFKNRFDIKNLALGIALFGNLITNFFGWPTVMSTLLFILFLSEIEYDQKAI